MSLVHKQEKGERKCAWPAWKDGNRREWMEKGEQVPFTFPGKLRKIQEVTSLKASDGS